MLKFRPAWLVYAKILIAGLFIVKARNAGIIYAKISPYCVCSFYNFDLRGLFMLEVRPAVIAYIKI